MSEIDEKEIIHRLEAISKLKPKPEVAARDLEQVRQRLTEAAIPQQATQQNVWRIILKSKIARLAVAAAVIIIMTMVAIHWPGGSVDLASRVFASALEEMQKMPWVHITTEFDVPQQKAPLHFWKCFDPPIEAFQDVDGKVRYCDYDKEIMYVYEPNSKTISIGMAINKDNLTWAKSPFEIISAFIESLRHNSKISRKKTKINGAPVEIIHVHIISDGGDATLIRDIERNLLISMEMKNTLPGMSKRITSKNTFDYPEQGPKDIYDLGVPRNAKIIDHRPKGDLETLIANVQRQFNKGYGDHIAMVLESWGGKDGTLKPYLIQMMRKYGQLQRTDTYFAAINSGTEPKSAVNLYEKAKNKWPDITWLDLTLEQVKKVESNEAIKQQRIFNGEYTIIRYKHGEGKITSRRYPGEVGFSGEGQAMNRTSWVDLSSLSRGSLYREPQLRLLPADPNHKGLVGLEIYEPGLKNPVGDKGQKIIGATTDRYWFDPSKDYLLMEHEQEMEKGRYPADSKSKTITLQVKQTSTGQWYPSHIRYERKHIKDESCPGKMIMMPGWMTDKRIVIDTEPIFTEDVFDPNYGFNTE